MSPTDPQDPGSTTLEITVDALANGGVAVGRTDGRVVFVRGAVPGERVRARITDDSHASFWRAETVEILDASPHRVPSVCAAAAAGAGCCDLAFIDPVHARGLKRDVLVDVLRRVGHLPDTVVADTDLDSGVRALADDPTGWRIRTRLAVDDAGFAGQLGFRADEVITRVSCAQPDPRIPAGIDGGFTPHAELVIVLDDAGRRHVTELAPVATPRPGRSGRSRKQVQQRRHRLRAPRAERLLEGTDVAEHRVGARSWQIPVTGFWQAHRNAPETYANTIVEFARAHASTPPRVAWDLYGGAGVFAAALLDGDLGVSDLGVGDLGVGDLGVGAVHVVDSDTRALAAAEKTFDGDDRVVIHAGEVAAQIGSLPHPDLVVLDPPRTGAGERVIGAIAAAEPDVVVHVGCDAARFARDLGLFAGHGYSVVGLRGFDAFVLTHHVEAIACLVRNRSTA